MPLCYVVCSTTTNIRSDNDYRHTSMCGRESPFIIGTNRVSESIESKSTDSSTHEGDGEEGEVGRDGGEVWLKEE